jgi:hypothetical protein
VKDTQSGTYALVVLDTQNAGYGVLGARVDSSFCAGPVPAMWRSGGLSGPTTPVSAGPVLGDTGEVELRGQDVSGIAVHIAARVAATAGAGEVLVSRTVADLIAGSEVQLTDRGEQQLKGIPEHWRLFAADL